ncbi:MAG TPA: TetR family transcriptional regulator C-terminal domain-containing protein [Rhizomicrobium sp.]|jgi:TetR/AcrR family transcriptional repressor of nem operon
MNRISNREKILNEGLKVVHAHGFANASVRDIVAAAGVPQGSFTNHFASKEAFGLEILDLYFESARVNMRETLLNDALPPLKRLRGWLDRNTDRKDKDRVRNGCLIGNFTAEASDNSEAIRQRLTEIFAEMTDAIASCLAAAVKAGELPKKFECEDVAGFILTSMQGATLLGKAERSSEPVERFKRMLFAKVLH